jgi:hypothetical protein
MPHLEPSATSHIDRGGNQGGTSSLSGHSIPVLAEILPFRQTFVAGMLPKRARQVIARIKWGTHEPDPGPGPAYRPIGL